MNVNLIGTNLPANSTNDIKNAVVGFFDTPEGKSYLTKWITDNNVGLMADKK